MNGRSMIFETYIRELREKHGISKSALSEGLCTRQEVTRLEEGDWEPAYFLKEALLLRLGVEAEKYECFLEYPDADHLDRKTEIMESILWGRLDEAEGLLERYRLDYGAGLGDTEEVEGTGSGINRGEAEEAGNGMNHGETEGAGNGMDCEDTGTTGNEPKQRLGKRRGRKAHVPVENRLAMQFYLDMLGQVRRGKVSQEKLFHIYDRAVRLTVPEVEEKPLGELALSVRELNLMLEAERNRKGGPRPQRLLELMEYILNGPFDEKGKVKLYPKTVYIYICCLEEKNHKREKKKQIKGAVFSEKAGMDADENRNREMEIDVDEDVELREYCWQGLEMLRDHGRMYYLWELLDIRGRLLERHLERLVRQGSWQKVETEKQLEENQRWKEVLEQVYDTWHVNRETTDDCYIYLPKATHCINDIIRIRRRMLGISRENLCQDICDTHTLWRLEKRRSRGWRTTTSELFRRLGLSGEVIRSELETSSLEAQELLERLRERVHKCCWDDAARILQQIRGMLDMEVPCNRQLIQNLSTNIRWKQRKIDNEEYCHLQREALETTIPLEVFLQGGEKYLTNQEQTCIQNMMQGMDRKSEEFMKCLSNFEKLYKPCMEKGVTGVADGMYVLVMGMVKSEYGDMGEYDKSDMYNEPIIQGCLRLRNLWDIPHALYARWWNYAERRKKDIPDDRILDGVKEVTKCLVLCSLAKDWGKVFFCQEMLKQLQAESLT